ncbi:hypothetical protein BDW62DRAFT_178800 [Aspergillus aurantiobrunneus]
MDAGKEDIFQKALTALYKTTKSTSKDNPPPRSLTDLQRRVQEIDTAFKKRDLGDKLWVNLDRILGLFEITGNVINAAVASTVAPASLIMSSFLHLIRTVRGSLASYQSIGDFLGRVAGTLDRMAVYGGIVVNPALGLILAKTAVLVSEILVVAAGRLGKTRKRDLGKEFLVCLFFGQCSELERKMTELQNLAQEEAMACISLIKRDTSMLQDELAEVSTTVRRIDGNIESQRFEGKLDLDTWHNVQNIHDGIQKERRAGVRAHWIIDEPRVQKWMRGEASTDAPVIWIHGEPAIGKSFAASCLITEIANRRKIRAYFYVRENDSATTIFKCLALQLAVRSRGFNSNAIKALGVLESVRNEKKIWQHFFVPFLAKVRPWRTYVIIDGLDAAPREEQRKVLEIVGLLKRRPYVGKATFHIAVISRSDLHRDMRDICDPQDQIHVSSERTKSDVAQYIRQRLSDPTRFTQLLQADREQAIRKLTDVANGMFLWVSLIIAQAEELGSRNDILYFLETGYPRGHENHIGKLLDSAAETVYDQAQFRLLLRWMAAARRALRVSELRFLPGTHLHVHTLEPNTTFSHESLEKNFRHLLAFTGARNASQPDDMLVQFKHRCFKDHLLCDPATTSSRPHSFTKSEAHATIFKSCLFLLQDSFDQFSSEPGAATLVNYAADHVIDHFMEIDIEKEEIGHEAKQQLRDILQNPTAIQTWYDGMSDKQKLNLIPSLVEGPRTHQKLLYCIGGPQASPKEFFSPLASFCAEGWLQTGAVHTRSSILFLDRYDRLVQDDPGKQSSDATLDGRGNPGIRHLRSDRIFQLAELCGFEQDANWHVRVASALHDANHLEDAIKQYREAEQKDPNSWVAKSGISTAFAGTGEYDKAVRKAQRAFKCVPPPYGACASNIYLNISLWQGLRGNTQAQIEAAHKAYSYQTASWSRLAYYFTVLGRNLRFTDLLELCKTLSETDRRDLGGSRLAQLLLGWEEGHLLFGRSAVESKKREDSKFVEQVLRETVKAAQKRGDPEAVVFQQYQLGKFYLQHLRDESRARYQWEKLGAVAQDDPNAKLYARQMQCRALAELYLTSGLMAEKTARVDGQKDEDTGAQEQPDIKLLKGLADETPVAKENCADAVALLGYWKRKCGQKNRHKDLFKAKICQGIRILQDEDPFNDFDGYFILGKALLLAGYSDQARRVFTTVMLPMEASTTNGTAQQKPFVCHGKPDCREDDWEKLYICHICHNTTLCGNCWKKLKDGKAEGNGPPYTTCHRSHLFSNIYHKGHKIAEPVAVMEGEHLKPDPVWLSALKKTWRITDDTTAAVSVPIPKIVKESVKRLQLVE